MPKFLYTRCPSCHAEIKFEAPDMQDKPEDYRPLVKCPTCGVTIAVNLSAPVNAAPAEETEQPVEAAPAAEPAVKTVKKPGTGRNVVVMLISLVFIAFNILGYLLAEGSANLPEWMGSLSNYSGITAFDLLINDMELFKAVFDPISVGILSAVIPMLLFVLACVNFIVAFVSACGKKYSRAYNAVSGIIIGGAAIVTLFTPYLVLDGDGLGEYMKAVFTADGAFLIAGAALGLVLIILVLCFIKPLEKKENA